MTTSIDSPPAFLYAPDFFKTNRIFTDGNQKIIRQHLDYAEANLLHVQKLKQDPIDEERIQDLSRRERELVDGIERCRVALAPIKKLPDDVLQCIFTICCEDPTQFLLHDSKTFLITLCQICCAWRSIALETPFLWSQIGLSYGSSYDQRSFHAQNLSDVEEAVKLWFARASTCPISLEVDVGFHHSTSWEGRELRNLVERVIALPSCYRKLDLGFSTKSMEVLLGKLSPYQLWHVEKLQVIDPGTLHELARSEGLNPPFSPTTTFPNLKELIVECYWNLNNLSSLMPFPRLQTLTIWITLPLVLELFQQCPLLEICKVTIERSDSTIRSRLAKRASYITLPQLWDIEISFSGTEDCYIFIDQLVLSNLQSLKIFASHEKVLCLNELAEHLIALSQRSGTPNIRELDLYFSSVSVLNLGILLRRLPHLESIITSGDVILDEETLDGLAMGTLGPCLSKLHADHVEADLAAITKMVKQRAQNVEAQLQVSSSDSALGDFCWNYLSEDDS